MMQLQLKLAYDTSASSFEDQHLPILKDNNEIAMDATISNTENGVNKGNITHYESIHQFLKSQKYSINSFFFTQPFTFTLDEFKKLIHNNYNLILENPKSLTFKEINQLATKALKYRKTVITFYPLKFYPAVLAAKQYIKSNDIKVSFITINWQTPYNSKTCSLEKKKMGVFYDVLDSLCIIKTILDSNFILTTAKTYKSNGIKISGKYIFHSLQQNFSMQITARLSEKKREPEHEIHITTTSKYTIRLTNGGRNLLINDEEKTFENISPYLTGYQHIIKNLRNNMSDIDTDLATLLTQSMDKSINTIIGDDNTSNMVARGAGSSSNKT